MADSIIVNMYPPLSESLEAVRPEMVALEPTEVLQIMVDPIVAVSTARGAMPRIIEYHGPLSKLADFDIKLVDKLPIYASAALHANALYLSASSPPEHFQQLISEATTLREQLLADGTALAKRDLIDGDKLDDLKGTTGHRNIASDVLTLVNLIRANWTHVVNRSAVTQAELDHAEAVGNQLVGDIGIRAQSPAAVEAFAQERVRSYTLLVNAYDEIRRALSYLRWKEDDVDRIAPSFFAGRRRMPKTATDALEEVSPPTVATTANSLTPITASPAAVVTAPTPTNKPAVGMPGADPFLR